MINLFESSFDVLSSMIVFVLGIYIVCIIGKKYSVKPKHSFYLYVWHTLFFSVAIWLSLTRGADDITYYINSLSQDDSLRYRSYLGTRVVVIITSIFTYYLGLSYLGTSLVFNIVGALGLIIFYAVMQFITKDKRQLYKILALIVVLLPSVSFWSAEIGKDALAFLSANILTWASLDLRHRAKQLVFAILLMLIVRPHIAVIIPIALIGSLIVEKHVSKLMGIGMVFIGLLSLFYLLPFVLDYSGLGRNYGEGDVSKYIDNRQSQYQMTSGGINISSMSLPMQLVSYLFRPLPFEAKNILQLSASLEHIVLLFIFIIGAKAIIKRKKSPFNESRIFLWFFSIISWVALAMMTSNLGIAARQKWMFLPALLVLLFSVMKNKKGSL